MSSKPPERIEVNAEKLNDIVDRAKGITADEVKILKAAVATLAWLTAALAAKKVIVKSLRQLLFGGKTESSSNVLGDETKAAEDSASDDDGDDDGDGGDDSGGGKPKKKKKGHGRNPADAYEGATRVEVPHESLKHGDACPECNQGKVYKQERPAVIVCVSGQAPVRATIYELERLRCNACGEVFTARAPAAANRKKHDETAAAMIGLLKYGSGLPFNRQERLAGNLGIPLPASTQWEIVSQAGEQLVPAYAELTRQAAQGDVVHNDDTPATILELGGKKPKALDGEPPPERTGVFTTAIVSLLGNIRIALFFSGRKHAGENLEGVLEKRNDDLDAPIHMCDALLRNLPGALKTVLGHCIAHARRKFVNLIAIFPESCRFVIEQLREVYKVDAEARKEKLSPEQRLKLHQEKSTPIMETLRNWMQMQFDERKVEPNSPLGGAIQYMLKRWDKFTLFLRVPGAPLDNNVNAR